MYSGDAKKWGFAEGVFSDLMENRSFCGSGRPRAAQKPFQKVGGKAPYLFKGFLGNSGLTLYWRWLVAGSSGDRLLEPAPKAYV